MKLIVAQERRVTSDILLCVGSYNGLASDHHLPPYLSENPVSVVSPSVWNLIMVKFDGAFSGSGAWLPQ